MCSSDLFPSHDKRGGIKLNSFELPLIDKARMKILSLAEDYSTPLNINEEMPYEPYIFSVGNIVHWPLHQFALVMF